MKAYAQGWYYDKLSSDGRGFRLSTGWRRNRIVQDCDRLLAALMKGEAGFRGVRYLAIGEGDEAWDGIVPSASPSVEILENEIMRIPLGQEHIKYLHHLDQPAGEPSNRLEITVEIDGADLVTKGYQPIREFGLFGGNATDEGDSGYLIDYVIHPRIDMTAELTLLRRIRLAFQSAGGEAAWMEHPEIPLNHPFASLTVEKIDGVGSAYASVLGDAEIRTIGDLAVIDPMVLGLDLPRMKLVELQAKARLVLQAANAIPSVSGLGDRSLWDIIMTTTEQLAMDTGISNEAIGRLREQVIALQVALDSAFLQTCSTDELLTPH